MVRLLAEAAGGAPFGALIAGLAYLVGGSEAVDPSIALILTGVGLVGGVGYGLFGRGEAPPVHRRWRP